MNTRVRRIVLHKVRLVACTVFGMISTVLVMILTSVCAINDINGWIIVISLAIVAIICGFIARVCYNSHFIVRHLVAIYFVVVTDFYNITTIGSKITGGMDNVRNECRNEIEFYQLVLKIYDAYYRREMKNGRF